MYEEEWAEKLPKLLEKFDLFFEIALTFAINLLHHLHNNIYLTDFILLDGVNFSLFVQLDTKADRMERERVSKVKPSCTLKMWFCFPHNILDEHSICDQLALELVVGR